MPIATGPTIPKPDKGTRRRPKLNREDRQQSAACVRSPRSFRRRRSGSDFFCHSASEERQPPCCESVLSPTWDAAYAEKTTPACLAQGTDNPARHGGGLFPASALGV